MTPGSTTANRLSGSIFRILLSFVSTKRTPSASGKAPPDRPVPGTPRDDGDFCPLAQTNDRLYLLEIFRQHHAWRSLAIRSQAVALKRAQGSLIGQHRFLRKDLLKFFDEWCQILQCRL